MNLTTEENMACYSLIAISIAYLQGMKRRKKREKKRKRHQALYGVIYAKHYVSKPRLNLITVLVFP